LKFLLVSGLAFRLLLLFTLPNLSQDFYRFIWDGRLMVAGINPYLYTPDELVAMAKPVISQMTELYSGMGELSARHYSNYPPLNQLLFGLASLLGGKSILATAISIRAILILADLGILYFGRKLLIKINCSPHLIFWYFLNPLVILELTGNLHFEGVMLFFLIWALYLTLQTRWYWAAAVYALAIVLKLVPLIFLPLFLSYYGIKKSLKFYLVVSLVSSLFFLPFLAEGVLEHYSGTLGLWFSNFEFNAGFYNLVKQTGNMLDIRPWNLIKSYGKIFPVISMAIVMALTFLRKNEKPQLLLGSMMWCLACYYLLTPTVHPWYIIPLLLLSLYTEYRFPLFWSAVIMLSYNAYSNPDFEENLWLLSVEYIVVFGVMLYELFRLERNYFSIRKN
jgi:hypothetical protein